MHRLTGTWRHEGFGTKGLWRRGYQRLQKPSRPKNLWATPMAKATNLVPLITRHFPFSGIKALRHAPVE